MFEVEYQKFLQEQIRNASGMRLEMIKKHGVGEKKLLELLWSVFRSFDGFVLEYEIVTSTGVRNFIDVYYLPLRIAFEAEGFVVHAEKITRDRFDSERNKIRSIGTAGLTYYPFSWDEMDKKPEACRRAIYELLGHRSSGTSKQYKELSPNEREVIRFCLRVDSRIDVADVRDMLGCSSGLARKVLKELVDKQLLRPAKPEARRQHRYLLDQDAHKLLR
ncbi:MarR family transcriptional regulator [Cohnella panacarvi]|uniref:MarR family transcriptional regulator n=1 Tax=Cohnella panacarvi TaxID=400776 RepID=UPI00047D6273|nr:MarR family transcriptional regulator [Cohnella panacarvi]